MGVRIPPSAPTSKRPRKRGLVLAGPGTGKSATVLQLAAKLQAGGMAVRARTFTRAATGELAKKIKDEGHTIVEPVTVHASVRVVGPHGQPWSDVMRDESER